VDLLRRKNQLIPRLLGFQQAEFAYEPMQMDAEKRLWIEPLQIWMSLNGHSVVCQDANGTIIGDYVEVNNAKTAAEQRIRELEAELARLRGSGTTE
jgi:hypothetical protein